MRAVCPVSGGCHKLNIKSGSYRLGVDVGGTNTDAVLMRGLKLVASVKASTTPNVREGIVAAIKAVISEAGLAPDQVSVVSIGTTHFTNAFVQRKGLDRVGVVRIALPASQALPPFSGWPDDMAEALRSDTVMVRGGYQYDGRINAALDEDAIARAARTFRSRGINAVALSALFSPVNDAMELRALEIISSEHPDSVVTLSSHIGRIGLLERENAGIMNASLSSLARETVEGFRQALSDIGIRANFYISQNDGTLMNADLVEKYPVLTFASGPTNSMRGAAFLSGLQEAMVVDIGGTTTDIGVLKQGFPRESSITVDIGGVRTNFRMPDILALGLGGGSRVDLSSGPDGLRIGPDSVGYEIASQAMVFGGEVLTATDIAVAAGYADIGDRSRVAHLAADIVNAGVAEIHRMIEEGVDRMKANSEEIPLILVGGGSILVDRPIAGVSETVLHRDAGVANAIGASIAQVGGEVDKVFSYEALGRDAAIERAFAEAKRRALVSGAAEETIGIMSVEELPLAYVPGQSVRVRMKVAGDLAGLDNHAPG